jgi:hypothetical protein
MPRRRTDTGPEWPERLLEFNEWEWSESEIAEAAEDYARRHAEASGLAEPLPPDAWPRHMRPVFAWSYFRRKWAREHDREDDLVDEMTRNRLERGRRGSVRLEEDS